MLVGRDAEQRAIGQLISGARLGQGGALLLVGEPGAGKTALLRYASDGIADMGVLRAVGNESEREIPFGGLSQLLRPALELIERIPGPQAAALEAALALRPGRGADRFAVGAATLSLLCRYAETRPVAVFVDDLHLWDRPSSEALAFAALRLQADPVALLATGRTGELGAIERDLPLLEIAGLDADAAAELVRARSAGRLTPDLLLRLHRATAGNPLALLELGDDPERFERLSPESPLPVSAAIATAFAGRVRALPGPARSALTVLAAAGGDLRLTTVACAALEVDAGRLADAEAAQLIEIRDDRAEFRHPLLRSAVYLDATPQFRRRTHGALAAALPTDDVDRRAWHLAESVLGPDNSVATVLERAGDRSRDRSAHAVASAAYERAARLSPVPMDRAVRLLAAAESAAAAGAGARSLALLDDASGSSTGSTTAPTALPSELAIRALELRAVLAQRAGVPRRAFELLLLAATLSDSPDDAAPRLAEAVYASFFLADARLALVTALRIEGLALHTDRARALGGAAAGLGRALGNAGGADQLRRAVDLLEAAPELHEDTPRLRFLLTGLLFLRDADSQAKVRRLVDAVRSRAALAVLPDLLFLVARDEATTDRWSRAEATYTEGIRLARETGHITHLAMSLAGLGWLVARQGREADCMAIVAEVQTICAEGDIPVTRVWLEFAVGELDLALGRTTAAVDRFDALGDLLAALRIEDPDLSPAPELTEALLRIGRADDARGVAEAFRVRAEIKGLPWVVARAERALALCSAGEAAERHWTAAQSGHALTLDGYEAARTRLAHGEQLRRTRRRTEARIELRSALATFEDLGATPWADRAAAELAATGEQVRRRDQPQAAALTPQELQISLLLSEGRTTREVAAALFLSPKTVEYHLRKVYTKLGIRSRAELTDALPQ